MLSARNVSASLGGRPILAGVDVDVVPSELHVLVGPNGSGKSTLMKVLAGELGYAGEVTLNGRPLKYMAAHELASTRAVLAQATNLSFPFTVREVVRLGIASGRSGLTQDEQLSLPDLALRKVDLAGFGGRFYQELSGGEQQRVQLARVLCQVWLPVLAGGPRLLLLDEPVDSLDIRHQLLVMEVARDFAARGGGVLAIVHDLTLAAQFADRVSVIDNGAIVASGDPLEVLTPEVIERVFGCAVEIGAVDGGSFRAVIPMGARR